MDISEGRVVVNVSSQHTRSKSCALGLATLNKPQFISPATTIDKPKEAHKLRDLARLAQARVNLSSDFFYDEIILFSKKHELMKDHRLSQENQIDQTNTHLTNPRI